MNPLLKRIDRLERNRGGTEGQIYYITAPRGMSSEQALASLGITLSEHDRVSLSTEPSAAPALVGQMPVYVPPGAVVEFFASLNDEEGGVA
jgi:hypothetical protein